jgi:uncharacterized protein YndB with AHSA1/START domain
VIYDTQLHTERQRHTQKHHLKYKKEIIKVDNCKGGDILGRIERSIEIKAPPEKVWEILALDRLQEWNVEYGDVKYTSEVLNPEDKYRVGASSHTNIKGAGAIDFKITESLQNEKITFRMLGKRANNTVVTYILEPFEEGTRFTHVMTYELPWGILGRFLGRLGKGMLEKEAEQALENLKSILEK